MGRKMWRRVLVAAVVVASATGGAAASAAGGAQHLTGADPRHATKSSGPVLAALPDLAITHRLPSGGMNLWRMPLSDLESGFAQPQLVKNLDFGGFSYDRSVTLTGDVADITPSDDGTADHLIWHAQPNGGVLLWAVGGGSDATPRLWQDLRTGGWSYADSHPALGDVNGDGWDDLVVWHRNGYLANVWVFLSDGNQLGAPQLWSTTLPYWDRWVRYVVADVNGDRAADLVEVRSSANTAPGMSYVAALSDGTSAFTYWSSLFDGPTSGGGWSFFDSRQMVGDVTGDHWPDLVTIHAQPNGGILVWLHEGCIWQWPAPACFKPPVVRQDLRTGGWSFAASRQYLADTNGDGIDDLVSVHQQAGNAGELIWRHVSTGSGLSAPQVIADLRTGGWRYLGSREVVANTWGVR